MSKVQVLVLRVAGTNCDMETAYAFERAGAEAEQVHINRILDGTRKLEDYEILAVPGGFSYGDDIGAGKVLANEIRYKLQGHVRDFIAAGNPVIGICNGFQVLVKSGLLPWEGTQETTLTWNDSGRFEDRWVHLRVEESVCPFMRDLPEIVYLPVAHAEGKFLVRDRSVLERLKKKKQVVFRYVTGDGGVPSYPENPNGSIDDIAGICDNSGLVLGMMPHPERCGLLQHYPDWLNREPRTENGIGFFIFRNVVQYTR